MLHFNSRISQSRRHPDYPLVSKIEQPLSVSLSIRHPRLSPSPPGCSPMKPDTKSLHALLPPAVFIGLAKIGIGRIDEA
ncbi:hypothetical protein R1flu_027207 [Riccia fluitans]|uniref:Uncharacterized protein n=1 Tax=Riccia fluitans TaxID=41844 RepID=A0ABD1XI47_9MARC